MKKIITLFAAVALGAALIGCSGEAKTDEAATTATAGAAATAGATAGTDAKTTTTGG